MHLLVITYSLNNLESSSQLAFFFLGGFQPASPESLSAPFSALSAPFCYRRYPRKACQCFLPSLGWVSWLDSWRVPPRNPAPDSESRWWQLKYVLFSPRSLGKWSNLTVAYFWNGLKPPTRSSSPHHCHWFLAGSTESEDWDLFFEAIWAI